MNRPLALLFALIGVALLVGISISISYRNPASVWLFSLGSVAFIAFGFVLKAKLRRKQQKR